jgi:hypothetical protein
MALEHELGFFESIRQELLNKQHQGKFALIKDETLVGTFARPEDAYTEGVAQFGAQAFLVKQILKEDRSENVPSLAVGVPNAHL